LKASAVTPCLPVLPLIAVARAIAPYCPVAAAVPLNAPLTSSDTPLTVVAAGLKFAANMFSPLSLISVAATVEVPNAITLSVINVDLVIVSD
jgi:hypothetical protein